MPKVPNNRILRRCRYCKGKFSTLERVQGGQQYFCCPGHKDLYHKYGPVSFEGILRRIVAQYKLAMQPEAITELATQVELLVDSRIYEALNSFRMEEATRRMGHNYAIERATDDRDNAIGAADLPALQA